METPVKDITIIVVDDEELLREMLVEELELEGFKVLSAASGNSAFEIVNSNNEISIVISDIKMPDGDGVELLKRIKSDITRDIDILLMSGYSDFTREQLLDYGARELLSKPFDFSLLFEQLELIEKERKK